jgi:hypothetical protein
MAIAEVEGPALGVHWTEKPHNGDYAAKGLAFALRGDTLYELLLETGEWNPLLKWHVEEHCWAVFRENGRGPLVHKILIARWGHIWPVPDEIWVELQSNSGEIWHRRSLRGCFSFSPASESKTLHLCHHGYGAGARQEQRMAMLDKQGSWQPRASWSEAQGEAGTLIFRTPAVELPRPFQPISFREAPVRGRVSGLAERRAVVATTTTKSPGSESLVRAIDSRQAGSDTQGSGIYEINERHPAG